MANISNLYQDAKRLVRRNPGENKSKLKRRQRQYIIAEYHRLNGVMLRDADVADAIRREAPDRVSARLASTIHEYRPDRSRLRKRGRLVERAVVDADRESADSQLRSLVITRIAKIARDRVAVGKAIHRDAIALGKTIANMRGSATVETLALPGAIAKIKASNARQRREARLRAPATDADRVDKLAFAVADHGWSAYKTLLASWRGDKLTKRQEATLARLGEVRLGNADATLAIADADQRRAATVARRESRQRTRKSLKAEARPTPKPAPRRDETGERSRPIRYATDAEIAERQRIHDARLAKQANRLAELQSRLQR